MFSRLTIRLRLWLLIWIAAQFAFSLVEQYELTMQEHCEKSKALIGGATKLVEHYGELRLPVTRVGKYSGTGQQWRSWPVIDHRHVILAHGVAI